jgi:hypothetical protein
MGRCVVLGTPCSYPALNSQVCRGRIITPTHTQNYSEIRNASTRLELPETIENLFSADKSHFKSSIHFSASSSDVNTSIMAPRLAATVIPNL